MFSHGNHFVQELAEKSSINIIIEILTDGKRQSESPAKRIMDKPKRVGQVRVAVRVLQRCRNQCRVADQIECDVVIDGRVVVGGVQLCSRHSHTVV